MKTRIQHLDIITECINGSRTAQKQLYDLYKVKMYTLCLRYMSSKADAEDMLQEGWVKVFSNLQSYNSEKGTFYGWIRKVFVNCNLEHLRKSRLTFEEMDSNMQVRSANGNRAVEDMGMQELVDVLQKLPTGYRSVFNLYVIEGYNHREIGDILGISTSTSKTQLMKAKSMMQKKVTALMAV